MLGVTRGHKGKGGLGALKRSKVARLLTEEYMGSSHDFFLWAVAAREWSSRVDIVSLVQWFALSHGFRTLYDLAQMTKAHPTVYIILPALVTGWTKSQQFPSKHISLSFFFFFFKETYLGGKVMRVDAVCLFLGISSFCALLYALDLYALCWGHSGSWAGGRKKSEEGGLRGCLFPLLLTAAPQLPASLWIFRVIAAPTPLATENCTVAWDFTQRITVNGLFLLFVGLRVSQVAQVGPSQLRMTLRSHSCIYLPSA